MEEEEEEEAFSSSSSILLLLSPFFPPVVVVAAATARERDASEAELLMDRLFVFGKRKFLERVEVLRGPNEKKNRSRIGEQFRSLSLPFFFFLDYLLLLGTLAQQSLCPRETACRQEEDECETGSADRIEKIRIRRKEDEKNEKLHSFSKKKLPSRKTEIFKRKK